MGLGLLLVPVTVIAALNVWYGSHRAGLSKAQRNQEDRNMRKHAALW